jgi:acetate kinase
MRDVENAAAEGNKRAQLALDMYYYRIKKYIGAYAAAMGGVDVIVLTGGIGENDVTGREVIMEGFEWMGVKFSKEANHGKRGKEVIISAPDSKVVVMVVPTNEELVIAQDTLEIVANRKK